MPLTPPNKVPLVVLGPLPWIASRKAAEPLLVGNIDQAVPDELDVDRRRRGEQFSERRLTRHQQVAALDLKLKGTSNPLLVADVSPVGPRGVRNSNLIEVSGDDIVPAQERGHLPDER